MTDGGLRREVADEVRYLLSHHWVRLLAGLAQVVLAAGGLYLFSALGEDSRTAFDVHRRTTLAAVGTALLGVGVLLCGLTLLARGAAARRVVPGREPGSLPRLRGLLSGAVLGLVGVGLGVLALGRWS